MGVAVDDTIHFLTWFRDGIRSGMERRQAIKAAYGRVALAMTQTTLIGGLGLSVFALSTFTPTQRFGTMMLTLLAAALLASLCAYVPRCIVEPCRLRLVQGASLKNAFVATLEAGGIQLGIQLDVAQRHGHECVTGRVLPDHLDIRIFKEPAQGLPHPCLIQHIDSNGTNGDCSVDRPVDGHPLEIDVFDITVYRIMLHLFEES